MVVVVTVVYLDGWLVGLRYALVCDRGGLGSPSGAMCMLSNTTRRVRLQYDLNLRCQWPLTR